MNKTLIITLVVVLIFILGITGSYNGFVNKQEAAYEALSNVEATYQRRADLIPNLVEVVKGYAKHESQTLENVIAARAKATQITISADDLTPEKIEAFQKAQSELSAALGKLMAVAEAYPDLKASQNFSDLQAQLEGTENRINEARQKYNKSVKDYNASIRRFPGSIISSMTGFEKMEMFTAEETAKNAPKISFE
jgi:LemA protein